VENPNLDSLGNQIIAYEMTITSILQVLAHADPATGRAIAQAMRDDGDKIPKRFQGVKERVDGYIKLVETQLAKGIH